LRKNDLGFKQRSAGLSNSALRSTGRRREGRRIRAKRSLGQHFLVDRKAVGRILRATAATPGEPLLEIGPGRGALTADLLEQAGRMAAVEVDRELAARLRARFDERLLLIEQDVLELELATVPGLLGFPDGRPLVVVGNLPYNISKPIVQSMIRQRAQVGRMVLMFQREVAQRLTARPGGKHYGPLGILAGLAYRIERLFELGPRAFAPPPKVVSAVTRWTPREPALDPAAEPVLRTVLASCFARRRRTLRNNLRARLAGDEQRTDRLLEAAGIDGSLRAEAIDPAGFARLARLWPEDALI
jgi:16S rRNA (adenine1518-N6/adenine1519-N6)-dimethyltransferase